MTGLIIILLVFVPLVAYLVYEGLRTFVIGERRKK